MHGFVRASFFWSPWPDQESRQNNCVQAARGQKQESHMTDVSWDLATSDYLVLGVHGPDVKAVYKVKRALF